MEIENVGSHCYRGADRCIHVDGNYNDLEVAVIRALLLTAMILIASPWVQALLIGFTAYYMAMRTFYRETN